MTCLVYIYIHQSCKVSPPEIFHQGGSYDKAYSLMCFSHISDYPWFIFPHFAHYVLGLLITS